MNNKVASENERRLVVDNVDINAYIANLFLKNGPEEHECIELYGLLDQVKAEDIEYVRSLISSILNQNTLVGICHTKPFGYSGDFFIIEKTYQNYLSSDVRYRNWDMLYQLTPATVAVRNRKTLAIEIFEELNKKALGLTRNVLILGSGPVTETFEFFEKNPDNTIVFEMLDFDKRAIAYAKNKNRKYLNKMTFHNANVIRFTPGRKFDLIWSAGLFDYFKGKHFVYLIKRYYEFLNEDGEMIIGNFNVENPSRRSMEIFCDWFLYHRSEEELKQFALQAGIEESKIEVLREPLGINLFLKIKK